MAEEEQKKQEALLIAEARANQQENQEAPASGENAITVQGKNNNTINIYKLGKEGEEIDVNKDIPDEENPDFQVDPNKTVNIKRFIKIAASIAFPGMLFYITTILKQTVNLAFIGNVYTNKSMIEAIGMVNLYLNCTLMSLYGGIIAGIETLCANALATKRYRLLGYYYQRARIVSYTITITLATIHWCTIRKVLKAFKLNDEVTAYGESYCNACLVYVFFDVQTVTIMRLNNVLGKSIINCYIFLVQLSLHPLWNYIFVTVFDLDVVGAGISYTISKIIGATLTTCYLWFYHPVQKANFWINKHCFKWKGIKEYLRFSCGAAFLEIAEWWGFELLAIIAIQFGDDEYAVYVLIAEFIGLLYSVPIGFMISITILIGEIVTKYPVRQVQKAAGSLVIFGLSFMIFIVFVFFLIKD